MSRKSSANRNTSTPALLAAADREWAVGLLTDVHETYRGEGWAAAMAKTAKATGIDVSRRDTEPGIRQEAMTPQGIADIEFFLDTDVAAVRSDTFGPADATALRDGPARIVPAAGVASRGAWNHRCTVALAGLLSSDVVEFPGGHNGNTTHPTAFAAQLRAVLA